MDNRLISQALRETGDLMEVIGENRFKIIAYHKAARSIETSEHSLADLFHSGGLKELTGVGSAISEKIAEIILSGTCSYLEKLRSQVPQGVREMLAIPGIGPKKVGQFYRERNIASIEELRQAAEAGGLRELPGMGERSEANILRAIKGLESLTRRLLLPEAERVARSLIESLSIDPAVISIEVAGSLRRMRESIGDLDILVSTLDPERVSTLFRAHPGVAYVVASGETKTSVVTTTGVEADLRTVEPSEWGSALLYFTGSQAHNVRLRAAAKSAGMKLSEYGLFERESGRLIASESEDEVYSALGMSWVPPVLREDSGEVELALSGQIPSVVEPSQIRSDLHLHTRASDGVDSLLEMAQAAMELGYQYIAITDHAERLAVAHGLSEERVNAQRADIAELNRTLSGRLTVFHGIEANVDSEGSLDWEDDLLGAFDFVIASIHGGFQQSAERLTDRAIAAMRSPYVDVLGHPTGRLIGRREPYPIDIHAVIEAAAATSTALELNCFPDRLDLSADHLRMAMKAGCMIALGSDSHSVGHLGNMRYGVATAQRGWVPAESIVNCLELADFRAWLSRSRTGV